MISSVFGIFVVVTSCFCLVGGSRILRSTLWGVVRGALPIRDRDLEVFENDLEVCVEDRAGTRKSGSTIEKVADFARRQLDLNIMMRSL